MDLYLTAVCIAVIAAACFLADRLERRRRHARWLAIRHQRVAALFVRGWLKRPTGEDCCMELPAVGRRIHELLASRDGLPSVPASAGIGSCGCSEASLDADIRFPLDGATFLGICPACDSWGIWPLSSRDERRPG